MSGSKRDPGLLGGDLAAAFYRARQTLTGGATLPHGDGAA